MSKFNAVQVLVLLKQDLEKEVLGFQVVDGLITCSDCCMVLLDSNYAEMHICVQQKWKEWISKGSLNDLSISEGTSKLNSAVSKAFAALPPSSAHQEHQNSTRNENLDNPELVESCKTLALGGIGFSFQTGLFFCKACSTCFEEPKSIKDHECIVSSMQEPQLLRTVELMGLVAGAIPFSRTRFRKYREPCSDLLAYLPEIPLYYGFRCKECPFYVTKLVEAVKHRHKNHQSKSNTYERCYVQKTGGLSEFVGVLLASSVVMDDEVSPESWNIQTEDIDQQLRGFHQSWNAALPDFQNTRPPTTQRDPPHSLDQSMVSDIMTYSQIEEIPDVTDSDNEILLTIDESAGLENSVSSDPDNIEMIDQGAIIDEFGVENELKTTESKVGFDQRQMEDSSTYDRLKSNPQAQEPIDLQQELDLLSVTRDKLTGILVCQKCNICIINSNHACLSRPAGMPLSQFETFYSRRSVSKKKLQAFKKPSLQLLPAIFDLAILDGFRCLRCPSYFPEYNSAIKHFKHSPYHPTAYRSDMPRSCKLQCVYPKIYFGVYQNEEDKVRDQSETEDAAMYAARLNPARLPLQSRVSAGLKYAEESDSTDTASETENSSDESEIAYSAQLNSGGKKEIVVSEAERIRASSESNMTDENGSLDLILAKVGGFIEPKIGLVCCRTCEKCVFKNLNKHRCFTQAMAGWMATQRNAALDRLKDVNVKLPEAIAATWRNPKAHLVPALPNIPMFHGFKCTKCFFVICKKGAALQHVSKSHPQLDPVLAMEYTLVQSIMHPANIGVSDVSISQNTYEMLQMEEMQALFETSQRLGFKTAFQPKGAIVRPVRSNDGLPGGSPDEFKVHHMKKKNVEERNELNMRHIGLSKASKMLLQTVGVIVEPTMGLLVCSVCKRCLFTDLDRHKCFQWYFNLLGAAAKDSSMKLLRSIDAHPINELSKSWKIAGTDLMKPLPELPLLKGYRCSLCIYYGMADTRHHHAQQTHGRADYDAIMKACDMQEVFENVFIGVSKIQDMYSNENVYARNLSTRKVPPSQDAVDYDFGGFSRNKPNSSVKRARQESGSEMTSNIFSSLTVGLPISELSYPKPNSPYTSGNITSKPKNDILVNRREQVNIAEPKASGDSQESEIKNVKFPKAHRSSMGEGSNISFSSESKNASLAFESLDDLELSIAKFLSNIQDYETNFASSRIFIQRTSESQAFWNLLAKSSSENRNYQQLCSVAVLAYLEFGTSLKHLRNGLEIMQHHLRVPKSLHLLLIDIIVTFRTLVML